MMAVIVPIMRKIIDDKGVVLYSDAVKPNSNIKPLAKAGTTIIVRTHKIVVLSMFSFLLIA